MERNCWRSKCWLTVFSILLLVAGYSETVYSQSLEYIEDPGRGVFQVGDPIWVSNRRFYISEPFFNLGGPLPVTYSLYYPDPEPGPVVNLYPIIVYTTGDYAMVEHFGPNKALFALKKSAGVWGDNLSALRGYRLQETDRYFYLMAPVDELVYIFYKPLGGITSS